MSSALLQLNFAHFADLKDNDDLYNTWKICTKITNNLENGDRLENLSWRLFFRGIRSKEFKKLSLSTAQTLQKPPEIPLSKSPSQQSSPVEAPKPLKSLSTEPIADNLPWDIHQESPMSLISDTNNNETFDSLLSSISLEIMDSNGLITEDVKKIWEEPLVHPYPNSPFHHGIVDPHKSVPFVGITASPRPNRDPIWNANNRSMQVGPPSAFLPPDPYYVPPMEQQKYYSGTFYRPPPADFTPFYHSAVNGLHTTFTDVSLPPPFTHPIIHSNNGRQALQMTYPSSSVSPFTNHNSSSSSSSKSCISVPKSIGKALKPEDAECENCKTRHTPLWRRSVDNQLLCNACGLFHKLHKRHRTKISRKTQDGLYSEPSISCTNCGTTTTPLWRKDEDRRPLCNACGLYLKLHGNTRPVTRFVSPSSSSFSTTTVTLTPSSDHTTTKSLKDQEISHIDKKIKSEE